MSIKIPFSLFEQFHSGWKIVYSHHPGTWSTIYIENPSRSLALNFMIEPENQRLIYEALKKEYDGTSG